ncbi:unnamed protein product [Diatraea saccharalis]|uniref:phospholipase A2 n=1 Tax=Diatraea saccharalis TaxID=40085 RepID=A0A9N9RBP5_9NEOP|nr:unnamed protein product [Diatraea saccharalis]
MGINYCRCSRTNGLTCLPKHGAEPDGCITMYHRVRRKMRISICAILLLFHNSLAFPKSSETTESIPITESRDDNFENNIIDFDEEYSIKFNKKYGTVPWHSNDELTRENFRYSILKDNLNVNNKLENTSKYNITKTINKTADTEATSESTQEPDFSVIPLELVSTTQNYLVSIVDSTTEEDLSVIPLSTTVKDLPNLYISETVTLPTSTQESETTTINVGTPSKNSAETTTVTVQKIETKLLTSNENVTKTKDLDDLKVTTEELIINTTEKDIITNNESTSTETSIVAINTTVINNRTIIAEILRTNSSKQIENRTILEVDSDEETDIPVFTEFDGESEEVPEDYYDSKDVVPTTTPKANNALTVLVGLAGSVVESVAERVVPKGIYDLFKRMQRQSEALESEKLRSREENGGLGQFGRGILKSISSGLSKPLSQLMAGVRDFGSLDSDRGFVGSLASGVTSVANAANSLVDSFKDRVQAIYPGTVWCGDGHSATARSGELGLFFFTDTCCRQHDACKMYIKAGETKHGLTNTGLFTRHPSIDNFNIKITTIDWSINMVDGQFVLKRPLTAKS